MPTPFGSILENFKFTIKYQWNTTPVSVEFFILPIGKFLSFDEVGAHAKFLVARPDIKTGDNWHPDPELIEQMLASSSSSDGSLSLQDYAQYRVIRETTLPAPFTGPRSFLATGEVGLILPSIGRDATDAVHVSTILFVVNQCVYSISFRIKQRKIHAEWAKSFFILSRLPDDWTPQSVPVTLKDVNDVRKKMQEVMEAIRQANKNH